MKQDTERRLIVFVVVRCVQAGDAGFKETSTLAYLRGKADICNFCGFIVNFSPCIFFSLLFIISCLCCSFFYFVCLLFVSVAIFFYFVSLVFIFFRFSFFYWTVKNLSLGLFFSLFLLFIFFFFFIYIFCLFPLFFLSV